MQLCKMPPKCVSFAAGLFQEEEAACIVDGASSLKRTSLVELGLLYIWSWALHLGWCGDKED